MRLALTLALVITATVTANQPMESSWGWSTGEPVGSIAPFDNSVIGMQGGECLGFVIARGQMQAIDHQIADGNFDIASLSKQPVASVFMPRGAVALLRAKELDKQDVELVLRPIPALETIR